MLLAGILNSAPNNIPSTNRAIIITQAIKSSFPVCSCCINFEPVAKSAFYLILASGYVVHFFSFFDTIDFFLRLLSCVNYVSPTVYKLQTLRPDKIKWPMWVENDGEFHLILHISNSRVYLTCLTQQR